MRDSLHRFDSLIRYHVAQLWPDADWQTIKAVAIVESGLDPQAFSPAGARGLMQLMPGTMNDVRRKHGAHIPYTRDDPDSSLAAGILYLRDQYEHLGEIDCPDERMTFALASYNCGRGYVNRALALARELGEAWQQWQTTSRLLAVPECEVSGRRPDYNQVWRYVEKVQAMRAELETPS